MSHNRRKSRLRFNILISMGTIDSIYLSNANKYMYTALIKRVGGHKELVMAWVDPEMGGQGS